MQPTQKLTIRQASELTGFCYQHIWNKITDKTLNAERQGKIWKIEPAELEKLRTPPPNLEGDGRGGDEKDRTTKL